MLCAATSAPATHFLLLFRALPEGNYNVTVTFGDARAETTTTVKAELPVDD
jgi:hypothetical protein